MDVVQRQREAQVHHKEEYLAMQAAQERHDFERILAAQQEKIRLDEEKQRTDKVCLKARHPIMM